MPSPCGEDWRADDFRLQFDRYVFLYRTVSSLSITVGPVVLHCFVLIGVYFAHTILTIANMAMFQGSNE
jgi:hypothetical protein